ncbi:hypothetical protein HOP50_20g85480 [Chloropicon primus]|uniref:Uncharacterized protein n=1 Tax=Chloropicon primus TaxID=1764295 RepID=A0A5B8MZC0_9CHLO|nr:hypothetical protein A3770_20p85150 [Chloropicon primus]UPR05198.1 hypothetical protein HOP50_20g85480 [Chloropicon primus]|eukprot:QDZ25997.1 hypothetical protein A3770_20p85150 [Chloropicon primus]
MFHMMSYREKRQKKSRMASAIIDLKGPVQEMDKVPMKDDLNTTYSITDQSRDKFKEELAEIMEKVNRIPVIKDKSADHTIVETSGEVKKELENLDDLIRNIEQWKDALISNEALPINLLVSLTVSVSWLLRCKAELTKKIDNLVTKSTELTNDYLLYRSRELNKALLDKITDNAELKAVEEENDKLKKKERSLAIAQRFARFALKMKSLREKRRRLKTSREGSSYSRYSSLTSRRTTPATSMLPLFETVSATPRKSTFQEREPEPIENAAGEQHHPEISRAKVQHQMMQPQKHQYSSFTSQLLDEEPYIWKASKNAKASQAADEKSNSVYMPIPSQVIDNFKPSSYILAPLPTDGDKKTKEDVLNRRESFLSDLNMTSFNDIVKSSTSSKEQGGGDLICEGLHGLAEKQMYTRQEVLEARIKHAKQLHQLQEIFEERIRSVNSYYQEIISSQAG